MYMLNPTSYTLKTGYTSDGTYIYDGSGNIIYQLGCKPASIASGATSYSCTTNTWALNSTALSQISEVTYYLGGISDSSLQSAQTYYVSERGTTVYSGRPTSWTGLVGLMYRSDYAYTFANGVNDECYLGSSSCYDLSSDITWLFRKQNDKITISPYYSSNNIIYIDFSGNAYTTQGVNLSSPKYPVVYLRSDIKLDGTGTSSDPYVIVE